MSRIISLALVSGNATLASQARTLQAEESSGGGLVKIEQLLAMDLTCQNLGEPGS